jgi:hypothetical protein
VVFDLAKGCKNARAIIQTLQLVLIEEAAKILEWQSGISYIVWKAFPAQPISSNISEIIDAFRTVLRKSILYNMGDT